MKLALALALFFAGIGMCMGQGAANNWYFGSNAGITFETSPPTAVTSGSLNTLEGCSTISSEDGELLFYTDGSIIYQSNGEIMQNGKDLLGNSSSTQSAIIIPKPRNTKIYYVFTVDVVEQLERDGPLQTEGINYSIVDFTNNPNGEVTSKNIHLLDFSAEKLSAVLMGCESDTVWMVALSSNSAQIPGIYDSFDFNTFYAYAIDENGVNATPVKSITGMRSTDQRGNLKFSPNGKKLACANVLSGLYLLDFNALTGRVTNPQLLEPTAPSYHTYGVEFSPNNRFLYAANYNEQSIDSPASTFKSALLQYDLESDNINGSKVSIYEQTLYRSSLQLGPDGRIYRSMSSTYFSGNPYLSVIENPNLQGAACNYVNNAISLGNGRSTQGLPPFNQSLFNRVDVIQNTLSTSTLNLCADESYTLRYEAVPGADYIWSKNGTDIPGATDPTLDIALGSGLELPHRDIYELRLNLNDGTCERLGVANVNYYKKPEQPDAPIILSQCEDADTATGFSIFNLDEVSRQINGDEPSFTLQFYEQRRDAELKNDSLAIDAFAYENLTPNQTLYALVENPGDCPIIVPFQLNVSSTQANNAVIEACDSQENGFGIFDLTFANDQLLNGQSPSIDVSYYLTARGALLEDPEQKLAEIYENTTPYDQKIYARLESNNTCFAISEVTLALFPLPSFQLETSTTICSNLFPETIQVNPNYTLDPNYTYTYLWMPSGQTTPQLVTNLPGTHTLTVTNTDTNCSRSRNIEIEERGLATIEEINVQDASDNNTVTVNISGLGEFEYALDENGPFQEENIFSAVLPGFYTVFVRSKSGCGVVRQDFNVIGFDKFFTPNGDGYNDLWQVKGINASIQPGTNIRIFDRYGKLLKELDPLSSGWDGTFNGQNLVSDDYWFRIKLEDGREFKSHFSLKR